MNKYNRNFNNNTNLRNESEYCYILGNSKIELCFRSDNRNKNNNFFNELGTKVDTLKLDSFSLILSKYTPIDINNNKYELPTNLKSSFLAALINKFNNKFKQEKEFKSIINKKIEQINEIKSSLEKQSFIVLLSQEFTTDSRLIIGLGSHHILETSLTLDYLYGIPIIPSSSIKGSLRAIYFWDFIYKLTNYINESYLKESKYLENIQKIFYEYFLFDFISSKNTSNKQYLDILKNLGTETEFKFVINLVKLFLEDTKLFINQELFFKEINQLRNYLIKIFLLFGTQDFKGLLLFLDSYPTNFENNLFDLDIMNTHYQKYYMSGAAPGDWEEPVPIFFLTTATKVPFKFNILFDEYRAKKLRDYYEYNEYNEFPIELKDIIKNILLEMINNSNDYKNLKEELKSMVNLLLKDVGIGAKTRLGYGAFK